MDWTWVPLELVLTLITFQSAYQRELAVSLVLFGDEQPPEEEDAFAMGQPHL